MARFPIQYAETTPTGRGPSVPLQLDVSTGAEYIARGISQLGGAMYEVAQKIENTNKILDLAKGERSREMSVNAALSALRTPGFDPNDDDAVQKIREKTETDMQAFRSKYNEVNNELIARYDRDYAQWDTKFTGEVLQLKASRAADEQDASEAHFYESGNKLAFAKLQYSLEATGAQGPEVTKKKIEDFDNTSALYRARIDIGNDRPQSAIAKLEGLKNLSGEQLDYRDKMLRMAQQTMKQNTDAAEIEVIFNMHTNKDKSLVEKANLGNQYIQQLAIIGLTGERYGVLVNRIERWMAGEDVKTDLRSYTKMKEALQDLSLGVKDKSQVLDLIMSEMPALSDTDGKSFIDEAYTEPDKEDKFWEKEAYQTIEKRLLTTDPISGRLFGSTEQYDATDRAKIRFDDAIKSAAKAGRPLRGTDYLKKAVEIANQLMPKRGKITFGGQTKLPPPTEYEEFAIAEKPEAILAPPVKYEIGQVVYKAGKQWRIVGFDTDGDPLVEGVK